MPHCYYHNCICIFTDVLNNCILYAGADPGFQVRGRT